MNFARPEFFWLFTLLPLLLLWAIRGRWKRRRGWEALAQRGRAPRAGTGWWLASVVCLIVALAQPRWGRLAGSAPPPGHDTILLVDVSRSMGVVDAVPNRLAVAVEAAEGLIGALSEGEADRAAVVAFAGRGVMSCPLTENLGAVLDALHRLRPGSVQPGGTDLGAGLDAALEAVDPQEHAEGQAIVIFTDGEDLTERWRPRLDRLRQRGVVVHAVAIGDPDEGHPVPSGVKDEPLRYHGEPVRSRCSVAALEVIAHQTGGALIRLGLTAGDLGELYRTRIEPAARRRRETARPAERAEQFPLFLVAALTLLLAGCWPPGRGWTWSGWWWRLSGSWRRSVRGLGRVALLIATIGLVTGAGQTQSPPLQPPPADGGPTSSAAPGGTSTGRAESAAEAVARGRAAYDAGRLDEALAAFEAAALRAPDAPVPHYNAAAVFFRLGRYDEASRRYLEARRGADGWLRTKVDYALGNTALAQGNLPSAIAAYDECIASTARGADLDAVRQYARENRQFAFEQAQSLAVPQGQGPDEPSPSRRPDRRRTPNGQPDDSSAEGQPEASPEAGGPSPEDGAQKAADRGRPPRGKRRLGGAGGSRSAPPGAAGDSPEDRLDAALEQIRAAQDRRLPDDPPPAAADADRKDW
jgi:Ca-activated chloride channel family protein